MGLVTVTQRDVKIQTPAGSFEGCVETTEENTQATAQQRITTLYCPGVGITRLAIEVATGGDLTSETATLRSFGKRVDIYELDDAGQ